MRVQIIVAGLFGLLALAGCQATNQQASMDTGASTVTGASTGTLDAPQGLVVTPQVGAIALSWQSVSGAAGYRLYWANSPGVSTDSTSVDLGSQTQYTLSASTGADYYLRVAAVNADGVPTLGNEVMSRAATPVASQSSDSAP